MNAETPVVARPKRIRVYVVPAAAVLVAVFAVTGLLMRDTNTGAHFAVSDQVAVILVGVLLALAVLTLLRPRVRADADGIEVRNVVNSRTFAWTDVRAVTFPDGAPWARVELLADEYYPAMGIQAQDGRRSVDVLRVLRALHRTANEGEPDSTWPPGSGSSGSGSSGSGSSGSAQVGAGASGDDAEQ